jgi:hypothetical protein
VGKIDWRAHAGIVSIRVGTAELLFAFISAAATHFSASARPHFH